MPINLDRLMAGTASSYSPEVWEALTPMPKTDNQIIATSQYVQEREVILSNLEESNMPSQSEIIVLEQRLKILDKLIDNNLERRIVLGKDQLFKRIPESLNWTKLEQRYFAVILSVLEELVGTGEVLEQAICMELSVFRYGLYMGDISVIRAAMRHILLNLELKENLIQVDKQLDIIRPIISEAKDARWQEVLVKPVEFSALALAEEDTETEQLNYTKMQVFAQMVESLSDPTQLEEGIAIRLDGITMQIGRASGEVYDNNRDLALGFTPFIYKVKGYTIDGVDLYDPENHPNNIQILVYDTYTNSPYFAMGLWEAQEGSGASMGDLVYVDSELVPPTMELLNLDMSTPINVTDTAQIPFFALDLDQTAEATRLGGVVELVGITPESVLESINRDQLSPAEADMLSTYIAIHREWNGDKFEPYMFTEIVSAAKAKGIFPLDMAVDLTIPEATKAESKRRLIQRMTIAKHAFSYALSALLLARQRILIGNYTQGAADDFANSISGTKMQQVTGTPKPGADLDVFQPYFDKNTVHGFILGAEFVQGMMKTWAEVLKDQEDYIPAVVGPEYLKFPLVDSRVVAMETTEA